MKQRWAQIQAGGVILAAAGLVGLSFAIVPTQFSSFLHFVLAPFSDGEATTKGFEVNGFPGNQPDVLLMPIRVIPTLLTYSAFFAFSLSALKASRLGRRPETDTENLVSNQTILTILAPFTACYLVLLVTRAAVFGRYFLPLLFLLLVFLFRFYQVRIAAGLPVLTAVFVVIVAAYGVVTLHDVLAADRVRLEAADTLRSAGVGRGEIRVDLNMTHGLK